MIGVIDPVVNDIQLASTSIVNNGVANIPLATGTVPGVVKINTDYGIGQANGTLMIVTPGPLEIKRGDSVVKPIIPYYQDQSVFYGLAKAAGDSTQSASTLTVGNYTD